MGTAEPAKLAPQKERIAVLMEQYKLLEARRDSFGRQFMQIVGFFFALFALLLGLFGKEQASVLASVLAASGVVLFAIAFLAHRLGRRQDDCERVMAEIEEKLNSELGAEIANLPKGAKLGARAIIVATLITGGVSLLIISAKLWVAR